MNQRRKRPGIFGPLLLISLGVIFLLNNLDIIQWSVWDVILRFWPVLLIAAGLDLILGQRSAWGSAIALILVLAVIGGGIALLGDPTRDPGEIEPVAIPGEGVERVALVLDPAIGYLQLSPGKQDQANVLQGMLATGQGEQIEQRLTPSGERLDIAIRTRGWVMQPFLVASFDRPAWDLELRPETELGLDVDLGVGKTELDLRQMILEDIKVHTGIGEITILLPESGGRVTVDVGIGRASIELPATVGVRIRVDTGLGTTVVPTNFVLRDGSYYSPGYDQADEKIDLMIDVGIGTAIVR